MTQGKYYRVDMLESEAGWGSRIDDSFYYRDLTKAVTYANEYNKTYNNQKVTPSWYIVAERPIEITDFKTVTLLNRYFNYHFDKDYCSKAQLRAYETEQKGSV